MRAGHQRGQPRAAGRRENPRRVSSGESLSASTSLARYTPYALFGVALLVRSVALVQLASHPVLQPTGSLDDAVYVQLAQRVATGDLRLAPDVYFLAPFYTYFLGGVLFATGSLLAARVVQVLLGAVAVLLIAQTARWWFGDRAAVVSGVLAAGFGLFAFNETLILQSSLDPFLTALALFAWTQAVRSGSTKSFVLAGLAFAALASNRPNAAISIGVAAALWLVMTRTKRGVQQTAAFAAGVVLLIAPLTARNRLVAGEWVPIAAHGGLNFYIGNGPGADGLWRSVPGVRDDVNGQVTDVRRVAAAGLGRPATAGDASDYFYGLGWTWIRSDPRAAARLLLRKVALTFNAADVQLNFSYAYFARDEHTILRYLWAGPWVILPFGILGLVLAAPREEQRGYVTWASFVASYGCSVAAFFVTSRYRLPLFVPLLTSAGAGAIWIWDAARVPNVHRLAAGIGVLAALAAVVNWPSGVDDGRLVEREGHILRLIRDGRYDEGERLLAATMPRERRPGRLLCRTGLAFRDRDDLPRALLYMQRGAASAPEDGWIRFHLGETLLAMERFDEGLAQLQMVGDTPGVPPGDLALDLAGSHQALGHVDQARRILELTPVSSRLGEIELLRLGDASLNVAHPAAAERFLSALVARAPGDAKAHELLGVALGMERRDAEAVAELGVAVRLDPANASAHLHLAAGYAQIGNFAAARREIDDALQLQPQYPEAEALRARLPGER